MRFLRLAWPAALVVATFVGVGLWLSVTVTRMGTAGNAPVAQVRLSAAMAGLFGGGAAALVVTLLLLAGKRKGD
jgi:hypothetical protein